MERLVSIQQQFPLQERSYVDRNGQNQVFVSRGFVTTTGIETFYAEATGDYARSLPQQFDQNVMHSLQAQLSVRDFRDKDGNTRYQTEVRIIKLV